MRIRLARLANIMSIEPVSFERQSANCMVARGMNRVLSLHILFFVFGQERRRRNKQEHTNRFSFFCLLEK